MGVKISIVRKFIAVLALVGFVQLPAITEPSPAQAAVSCTALQSRLEAAALGRGDVGAAARIRTLCRLDCPSIHDFYVWLPNAYSSFDADVLTLWRQCTSGSGGGGVVPTPNPCKTKNFSAAPAPKIVGTLKSGYEISVYEGKWKPAPVDMSVTWYRNGKAVSTSESIVLGASDIGKTFTVAVSGSLRCYKTKTVKSSVSRKVVDGKLKPISAAQLKLQSQDGQNLEIKYLGVGSLLVNDATWNWQGHAPTEWANDQRYATEAPLPKKLWQSSSSAEQIELCEHASHFLISAQVKAQVPGRFAPTVINLPPVDFQCISDSTGLRPWGQLEPFSEAPLSISSDYYGFLEIVSAEGTLDVKEVEWQWVGHQDSSWSSLFSNSITAELPTISWTTGTGDSVNLCRNNQTFSISARVLGSIPLQFEEGWKQLETQVFTCHSETDDPTYSTLSSDNDLPSFSFMDLLVQSQDESLSIENAFGIFNQPGSVITWTWIGHETDPWNAEFSNSETALLPYELWYTSDSDFDGVMDSDPQKICRNGTNFNIAVTVRSAIQDKYSLGTKSFAAKTFTCTSDTSEYRRVN